MLTAYNGVTITHDQIGNPLNDGTWTYDWDGRQLDSMTNGITTWSYKYNADGLRTEKTDGTTTYKYYYSGDQLIRMTVGNNVLEFIYDGNTPKTVTVNGSTYFYITNLQGDVVAIVNGQGRSVALYSYDAWGNVFSDSGGVSAIITQLNPLRYRGYVYDSDTGLYYLQSRYYDPEMGRFLNADSYASTGQGIIGNNMFAYCQNSPVFQADPSGHYSIIPIPTLVDYYYMHKAVQYDIVEQYGFGMEVYVTGPEGSGWLDLYDGLRNEYYEVKHKGAASGKHLDNQLKKYDASHVSGWRFDEYLTTGNVAKGKQILYGKTLYSYWDITYRSDGDGLIIYWWEVNEERYAAYAASVATVATIVALSMCTLGGQSRALEKVGSAEAYLA